jgi:hypothetical protein
MRVLCVGRHAFLSEHLCRVFGAVGALCEPAIGPADVPARAARFEPSVVICEGDLLTPQVLASWAHEPALSGVPVIAVSMTPRSDDLIAADLSAADPAATIYLPSLDRARLVALLDSVRGPRGVSAPRDWRLQDAAPTAVHQL